MPSHISAEHGWGTSLFYDSKIASYDDTPLVWGTSARQALKISRKTISTENLNEQEHYIRLKPLLSLAGVKTMGEFEGKALYFDVTLNEKGFTFCPWKYERGGFSSIDPDIVIPANSSDEEIGRAMGQVLQHCIGKGGKRLADFQKEAPKPPLTDSEVTPEKGISGFGYKNNWFAVKSQEPEEVARALGIKSFREIEWNEGVDKAYQNSVFITPPIDGWVLAVGIGLFIDGTTEETMLLKAKSLSKKFNEVQYFATHRVVELHTWVKSVNGEIVRAYSYIGESGENVFVEGEPTPVERQWNLINTFLPEAEDEDYWEKVTEPDEDTVMTVAESWSINPSELSSRDDIPAKGLLGKVEQ